MSVHSLPQCCIVTSSVPHSVRSQFFLTFKSCAHLDGKHVVFGKLVLLTVPFPQRSRYRLGTHDAVRGFGLGVKRRSTRQAGVHVARCASMATGRGRRTRRVLERTIGCVQTAGWSVLEAIELLGSESGTPSSRVVRPKPTPLQLHGYVVYAVAYFARAVRQCY